MGGFGMGGGMGWGWVFGLLVLAGIIALVVVLVRGWDRGGGSPSGPGTHSSQAEEILAQRYARGEIHDDEYQRRLRALRGQ